MATIVTRAGKGSPLTNAEVDANFVNLNNDKLEVAAAASTYAPLEGAGASGTWNISITGNAGTVTNGVYTSVSYANPSWITSLAETKVLPTQTGNSGKFLTTNGTSTSWGTVDLTPYLTTATAASTYAPLGGAGTSGTWGISITGNAATATNGVVTTGSYANPSWITSLSETKVLPSQAAANGLFLTSNGTSSSWAAVPSPNNGALTLAVSGTGLSGSASFTANQSGASTFTVTSNATSANTVSTIVARDASGNFSAGTITASLSGNASTATSATTATTAGTCTGNAATVTGGFYLTGTQTATGDKTFSSFANRIGASYVGTGETYVYDGATNSFFVRTGASGSYKYFSLASNGDLSCGGAITATGNVTAYSDERLKENIATITNALAKVESVRGVTYTRKLDGTAGIGVIAQEIRKIAPEAIEIDKTGMMSVAYGNLVGLLIEAVKELSGQVKELQVKVGK